MELLLDTHHMFLEDREMYEVFGRCADKIGHLHISDSNRRFPEGGNIDFARIAQKLKEIKYSSAVSLEVVPYPTGLEAARRGIEWMKRYW
jgi:sugar phosphate isomerase/epimerase